MVYLVVDPEVSLAVERVVNLAVDLKVDLEVDLASLVRLNMTATSWIVYADSILNSLISWILEVIKATIFIQEV